jgi:CheY-like chemotaxis protein
LCAQILALLELDENSHQVIKSLEVAGHSVVAAKTFREAIQIIEKKDFALIISDVHLENGGTVFDFLKWVRNNAKTLDTQFVLFSCQPTPLAKYVEDGVKTTARLLGATKYITMESFDSGEFSAHIQNVLSETETKSEAKTKINAN